MHSSLVLTELIKDLAKPAFKCSRDCGHSKVIFHGRILKPKKSVSLIRLLWLEHNEWRKKGMKAPIWTWNAGCATWAFQCWVKVAVQPCTVVPCERRVMLFSPWLPIESQDKMQCSFFSRLRCNQTFWGWCLAWESFRNTQIRQVRH